MAVLKEYWKDVVNKYANAGGLVIHPSESFKEKYHAGYAHAIELAIKMSQEGHSTDDIQEKILSQLKNDEFGGPNMLSGYDRMLNEYNEIIDLRKQEMWADLVERVRYLLFRVLTAIGIAAVILGTGLIAHKAGIPLPLLKVSP
jgi:hypothetical protein